MEINDLNLLGQVILAYAKKIIIVIRYILIINIMKTIIYLYCALVLKKTEQLYQTILQIQQMIFMLQISIMLIQNLLPNKISSSPQSPMQNLLLSVTLLPLLQGCSIELRTMTSPLRRKIPIPLISCLTSQSRLTPSLFSMRLRERCIISMSQARRHLRVQSNSIKLI